MFSKILRAIGMTRGRRRSYYRKGKQTRKRHSKRKMRGG